MAHNLQSKNAVVCGSTQGIGKAVALELASRGATVTLVARNLEALKEVCGELPQEFGQNHSYFVADFEKPQVLRSTAQRFAESNPPQHILINNTGGPPSGAIVEAKEEEFLRAFSNHLICNHILVQAFLPGMKSAGFGRIINIISTSVKQPIEGLGVSNTTRAAVANWAKTLAGEVGQFAITVNNVLPGYTETERLKGLIEVMAERKGVSVESLKKEWMEDVPLKRFCEPREIAYAVAFLASPEASYINGINLPVDGGRTSSL